MNYAFLRPLAVVLALAPLFAYSAQAHDFTAANIKVVHPWSRATPPGAKVGGGYLKIENKGAVPDRLLGGTSEIAPRIEVHETTVTDGVARMRPLGEGLQVPADGGAELKPGGVHLMLLDLKSPLKQGEKIKATLMFEQAGRVEVEFEVDSIGAQPPETAGHDGH
jgi:periplasmic copper chaperone A